MPAAPEPEILAAFEAAKGFMPVDEGLALYAAAAEAAALGLPLLEVGTLLRPLHDPARRRGPRGRGRRALTVDHHRGSEEQQPGWEYHDPDVVDPEIGLMDTLPTFRRTLHAAGLEDHVVALVGRSPQVAAVWGGAARPRLHRRRPHRRARHRRLRGLGAARRRGRAARHPRRLPRPGRRDGQAPYRVYLRALDVRRVHGGLGDRFAARPAPYGPGGLRHRLASLTCRTQVPASNLPGPGGPGRRPADRRARRARRRRAARLGGVRDRGRAGGRRGPGRARRLRRPPLPGRRRPPPAVRHRPPADGEAQRRRGHPVVLGLRAPPRPGRSRARSSSSTRGTTRATSEHTTEINRQVDIGTNSKECDTTGTATNAGYTEAEFTLDVAHRLRTLLRSGRAPR